MFIKFDDLDMLEFFENEPISLGEEAEPKSISSMKDSHQFWMILRVDSYAKKINMHLYIVTNGSLLNSHLFDKLKPYMHLLNFQFNLNSFFCF